MVIPVNRAAESENAGISLMPKEIQLLPDSGNFQYLTDLPGTPDLAWVKWMDADKKMKLATEGYIFDSDLSCFVNKKDGKIFSDLWVERNNVNTLQAALSTPHNRAEWNIFLNPEEPYEETRTALFEKYGKKP